MRRHVVNFVGFKYEAQFIRSKHGSRSLVVNGAKFVKDRTTNETINWRCANFIRFKCKARAITREIEGREMVKLSQPQHTHEIDLKLSDYNFGEYIYQIDPVYK